MSDPSARTFSADFKRFFLRGLVVLLPTVLTLWIVVKAYQFVDHQIAKPINAGLQLAVVKAARLWEPLQKQFGSADAIAGNVEEWWNDRWYMRFIGLIVAIVAVYIVGRLLGGFFGRQIYRKIETVITTLPIFKQVYPHVKQIVDFLFSDDKRTKFNRVVVVQYPRKGVWSIGFLTGNTLRSIADRAGDAVTVFIPSSPTPFTGYTITVPRCEALEVPISVDEALRFTISGGVLVPGHQVIGPEDTPAVLSPPDGGEVVPTAVADDDAADRPAPGDPEPGPQASNPDVKPAGTRGR